MTVTQSDGGYDNKKKHWGPERHIVINREPGRGLGLSIVGGNVDVYNGISGKYENISGIFIKHITPNSPADKTQKLKAGDRIIEVGGVSVGNSTHQHAVELIQIAGDPVHLLVQSLEYLGSGNSLKSEGSSNYQKSSNDFTNEPEVIQEGIMNREPSFSKSKKPLNKSMSSMDESQRDVRRSSTKKSIRTKAPPPPTDSKPLEPVMENTNSMAVREKENDESTATTKKENDENGKEKENKESSKSKYSSDESSDEEEDTRHLEGNVYTKEGIEISRKSAGNVKRTKAEIDADPEKEDEFGYTTQKIQKKYRNLGGTVLMIKLEKERRGLGISLSGHKDRSKMGVFICGINPNGIAAKNGGFKVFDEVLEVNGQVVQGRCHLNASAVIKGIAGKVFKIVILRKSSNIDLMAIRPITQFPSELSDDSNLFSQYKGVHAVPIKKGQYGLGIMIIEGKHAEVGRGIFVSDIQEGSAAEQAGLQVGDLILAVNFDSLADSNYDDATALLKKTEGVVTLTVCNPNQKKVAEDEERAKRGEAPDTTPGASDSGITKMETKTKEAAKVPEKPKEPEPPADPKVCKIIDGKDTTIEFKREAGQAMGLDIIGGTDTPMVGVFVLDVYADGSAGKDGRLKPGDLIIDFCHKNFKAIENEQAYNAVFTTTGVITMIVFRQPVLAEDFEVEMVTKPGKGIGLCITGYCASPGAYVSEVIPGTSAGDCGKFLRGDRIVSVADEDVREASVEDIAVLMKGLSTVKLKLARYKSNRK